MACTYKRETLLMLWWEDIEKYLNLDFGTQNGIGGWQMNLKYMSMSILIRKFIT